MAVKVKRKYTPAQPDPLPVPALEKPMTYEDVAALLGCSPRQVRRWCDEGKLGFVRLPQGRRILAQHYNTFLQSNSVEAA